MRRGMRHSHLLGSKKPIFYDIFKTLLEEMSNNYPELERAQSLIKETLKKEEEKFLVLLDKGIKILNEEISKIDNILPGDVAFKLYETYGFPIDLTEDILKYKSLKFDKKRFDELMRESIELARKNWKGSGDSTVEKIWYGIKEKIGTTEFLGYEYDQAQGIIKYLLKKIVDKVIVNLMRGFIKKSFPVTKIKMGRRFKRGVIVDGSPYLISSDLNMLRFKVHLILKGYYAASDEEIYSVIDGYYGIS